MLKVTIFYRNSHTKREKEGHSTIFPFSSATFAKVTCFFFRYVYIFIFIPSVEENDGGEEREISTEATSDDVRMNKKPFLRTKKDIYIYTLFFNLVLHLN